MIGQSVSHYKIVEKLGAGGMGVVYRAFDTKLDRLVALKFLSSHLAANDSAKQRFLSEARAASAIEHPNIGTIHDIGETLDGNIYIVMAYYPGRTLREKLLAGPLAVNAAIEIALQVARGLAKAHARGIVHRDVKPPNLLLTDDGTVKILDFGLAKVAGVHLTSGGGTVGTPAYMAPEQVRGEPVDQRCDIWALGVVLYEMVTGTIPFTGASEHAVFEAILHQPMPLLRVPGTGSLEKTLRRSLEKRREDRHPSMDAFADALSSEEIRSFESDTLVRPPVSRGTAPAVPSSPTDEGAPVRCLHCDAENRHGQGFCGQCGHPLARRCSRCGSENDPKFRFCGSCGTSLETIAAAPGPVVAAREESHGSGEQRQMTALSCELSDFASLSNWIEPEELAELLTRFRERSTEVIERFEGSVAQYAGDGLLAYFGYPRAHEDDALRAIKSAKALIEALEGPNRDLAKRSPADRELMMRLRVGIHTGMAVTGVGGTRPSGDAVLGNVGSLATKIQQRAAADEILASPDTLPLVRKHFDFQYTGSREIPGLASPMRLYRIEAERSSPLSSSSRLATSPGELVGRAQELQLVRSRWEKALHGTGQTVLVSGEPGIGKSRLTQAFLGSFENRLPEVILCQASPFFSNTPFHPIAEAIKRLLGSSTGLSSGRVEAFLSPLQVPLAETLPLLVTLLGLPPSEEHPPAVSAPHVQKQRTLEALLQVFAAMAQQRPLVLIVEDLHWVDPSTRELLDLLVEQAPTIPVLLLLTFRPDFPSPWTGRSHVTHITLDRLSDTEASLLVHSVASGTGLDPDVVSALLSKADGVPLYLEELARMLLEELDSSEATKRFKVPSTLQDSLTARLDRLGSAKSVAQLAATIGREFSYELLQALTAHDESVLREDLAKLVKATILYQRGIPPKAVYTFKHALMQEAAYGSLLKSTRQQYHSQIAQTLETRFARMATAQPEVLAHHYTASGWLEPAVSCWLTAGRQALGRSAAFEATNHLRTGLALVDSLPEGLARDRLELALHMSLFTALSALKGYGAEEVAEAQERARTLCARIGSTPELLPVLQGLFSFAMARSSLTRASGHAEELLALAESQSPDYQREGHYSVGVTRFFQSDFERALHHLELAAPESPEADHSATSGTGADNAINSVSFRALALWMTGQTDRARSVGEESLELARRRGHPLTLASGLYLVGFLHQYLGDWPRVQELGQEMEELARDRGFLIWELGGKIAVATSRFRCGEANRSQQLDVIQRCGAALAATGLVCWSSFYLGELAAMCVEERRLDEARDALERARALVDGDGEQFWRPEILRLQGELALAEGRKDDARTAFEEALSAAERRSAKSLALRAATSLGALTGRSEVLTVLFEELRANGETADLERAREVLEQGGSDGSHGRRGR